MRKPSFRAALLAVVLSLVVGGVRVTVQSGSPTILLVVSATSPNPFGRYLEEVLRVEGLNAVTTVDVNSVNSGVLASAKLVVLAEMPLNSGQAQLFIDHVNGGGRLVAMRPDGLLASALGVSAAGTSQTNGYLAINQAQAPGAGLAAMTLPFAGVADHYTPLAGTATLATLYSSLTTATPYAAVVRSGRTAAWAFDLARSVAYRRQGDPALSGFERDGTMPYRTMEPFYQAIDRERMSVPHVDVQVRLFSRTITDLLADDLPMPRLWYFPGGVRALMIPASDAHVHDQGAFDALVGKVESLGGTMTFYPSRWLPYPNASAAAAWRQRGHELGVHPIGWGDNVSLAQGWQTSVNYFTAANWGPHGTTARAHDEEWVGWVGGADLAVTYGVRMELSAYTWGPAIGDNIGPQAKGYITGSGLPMRFVNQAGAVLPVHQQLTSLIDHQLFINDGYSELTTIPNGLTFSRSMIDQAVSDYHTVLATQFQADYYQWGEVRGWVDGTLDYAASRGLPLWAAQRWSNYTLARDGATIEAPAFDRPNGRLTFTLRVPASSEALSVMLPASYEGGALGQVTVNGAPATVLLQTINGRPSAFFSVPATPAGSPTPFSVVAAYGAGGGSDTTPPVISALAASPTGPTTATITWTTNEPATSRVEYGVGSPSNSTATDTTLVTSHSVALTGLTPSTSYVYRAVSLDAADNERVSGQLGFTTPGAAVPSLSVNDVAATEGTGGSSTLTFTVSLSIAPSSTVTVNYATAAGTATSPADFAAATGTLSFTPGATTRTVAVSIATDALDEPAETFTLGLSSPSGATIADGSGTGTINDDDPTPSLAIADASVTEGTGTAGTASLTVTLSAASGQAVSIGYATVNGTAVAPGDFTAVSGTLNFAAGVTSQAISVPIAADALVETNEGFTVQLSSPVNATLADATGAVTIVDDDSGGGGGPTTLTIPVASAANDVNESGGNLQTGGTFWVGNEATAGSYAAVRFTGVTIPRGATITEAHVEVRSASTAWNMLSFEIAADAAGNSAAFAAGAQPSQRTLSAARVAHLTDQQWVSGTWYSVGDIIPVVQETVARGDWASGNALSIIMRGTGLAWGRKFTQSFDTDPASAPRLVVTYVGGGPVLPAASIADVTVTEGTGGSTNATFAVTLSASPTQAVTIAYATADGSATAPADYAAGSGTLTFGIGVTSQSVVVPIVTDSTVESSENFSVVLSNPTNATIADGTGVGTITNDDQPPPALSINDVTVTEGTGGSTTATFTVSLNASPTQAVTVGYATANGSAAAPGDYAAGSGTLTFGVGVTSQTVSVSIVTDSTVESNETFSVVLSNPTNATIADGTGVATIVDDDAVIPSISINDPSVTEGTGGTVSAVFTVTLSASPTQAVTVGYATANGTASAPGDYTAGSGTLTFGAGVTSQTVSVPIVTDSTVESNETFSVVLSNPTNATIADGTGIATIVNDDQALPTISISDVSVTEGTGGTTTATLQITLSAPSAQTVTVTATTADGTAVAPGDYTAGSAVATFAPGVTSLPAVIAIVTDNLVESNETFSVVLSNPGNATIADGTGVVTILNDDVGAGPVTATFQIAAGADDVNQEATSLTAGGNPMWIGTGSSATASYVGLRFAGVTIPRNATITSARLEVNAASTTWITLGFEFGIEAAASSAAFSAASLPSSRTLLTPRVQHSSNAQWTANAWITLDEIAPIVQALVARGDWNPGNALGLILRGTAGAWSRKPIKGFETGAATAPRLVVTYTVP